MSWCRSFLGTLCAAAIATTIVAHPATATPLVRPALPALAGPTSHGAPGEPRSTRHPAPRDARLQTVTRLVRSSGSRSPSGRSRPARTPARDRAHHRATLPGLSRLRTQGHGLRRPGGRGRVNALLLGRGFELAFDARRRDAADLDVSAFGADPNRSGRGPPRAGPIDRSAPSAYPRPRPVTFPAPALREPASLATPRRTRTLRRRRPCRASARRDDPPRSLSHGAGIRRSRARRRGLGDAYEHALVRRIP